MALNDGTRRSQQQIQWNPGISTAGLFFGGVGHDGSRHEKDGGIRALLPPCHWTTIGATGPKEANQGSMRL